MDDRFPFGQREHILSHLGSLEVLPKFRSSLGEMRLPVEKAISIVRLFVEGCSVRTSERVTEVHRDTILRVLVLTGERC
jgi:hypothetical protein